MQSEQTDKADSPLTLGYSPCPNDTFIFYGLVHNKIDTHGIGFREILLDVETLNRMALNSELDITKVSFHAYKYLKEKYELLRSGGAMGRGCGPLVVVRERTTIDGLRGKRIAVPGLMTTAFMLLRLYDPDLARNVIPMPFNEIMGSVRDRIVDAGLIIHESRFTYPSYGLFEVIDLGKWWEATTGLPLPLGCIIARRELGKDMIGELESLLRKSVEYAFSHRGEARDYIKTHSQELDDRVIDSHINLYVNEYSLDFGEEGLLAVEKLFKMA